jgi:hypothetical protein
LATDPDSSGAYGTRTATTDWHEETEIALSVTGLPPEAGWALLLVPPVAFVHDPITDVLARSVDRSMPLEFEFEHLDAANTVLRIIAGAPLPSPDLTPPLFLECRFTDWNSAGNCGGGSGVSIPSEALMLLPAGPASYAVVTTQGLERSVGDFDIWFTLRAFGVSDCGPIDGTQMIELR